jgi:hypothetical protein
MARTRDTSLTTADTFVGLIAHLPLLIVERHAGHLAVMPKEVQRDEHLWHALQIIAGQKGLRTRRGCAVWTVKGFAQPGR